MDAFPSPAAATGLGEERQGQLWDLAPGAWEACFPSQIGPRTPPKPWGCWMEVDGTVFPSLWRPGLPAQPALQGHFTISLGILGALEPHNKVWQTSGA